MQLLRGGQPPVFDRGDRAITIVFEVEPLYSNVQGAQGWLLNHEVDANESKQKTTFASETVEQMKKSYFANNPGAHTQ